MFAARLCRRRRTWTNFAVILAIASAVASAVAADSPWLQTSPLPQTPAYHSLLANGKQLVVIGGDIGSGPLAGVLVASTRADGAIGQWRESPHQLPQPLSEQAAVMVGRRIYVFGGTNGRSALRTVFSTDLTDRGPSVPWRSASDLLPAAVRGHSGVVIGREVFVLGGRDEGGKARTQILRNLVDARGEIGGWQEWGSLPQPLAYAASVVVGKQVYLIGGENDRGPVQDVYAGAIAPNGELRWERQPPLPRPASRGAAFVTGKTLYYLGGYDGEKPSAGTYAAPIDDDGRLGDWMGWLPLPGARMALAAVFLNGRAYAAGGFDGSRYLSSLVYLPIDKPTAVTTTPPRPTTNRQDILSMAVAGAGLVAVVSLVVVTFALVVEKRSPPGQ